MVPATEDICVDLQKDAKLSLAHLEFNATKSTKSIKRENYVV